MKWLNLFQVLIRYQKQLLPTLDEVTKKIDVMLSTIGDDAELSNIDLQNMLQQQQQTLQLMSNVSKMLHDTSTVMIRKIV